MSVLFQGFPRGPSQAAALLDLGLELRCTGLSGAPGPCVFGWGFSTALRGRLTILHAGAERRSPAATEVLPKVSRNSSVSEE